MSSRYEEEGLSSGAREIHRALASLQEELEAVDWYHQRADTTEDKELKAVLLHNRDEEVEHAAMALEWLRRRLPVFDQQLRTYLFTEGALTEIEEQGEETPSEEQDTSLGLGSLR